MATYPPLGTTRANNLAAQQKQPLPPAQIQPTAPTNQGQGLAGQNVALKGGNYQLQGASQGVTGVANSPLLKNPSTGNGLTNQNYVPTTQFQPTQGQPASNVTPPQNVPTPGVNPDGTFDQNYVPTSEADAQRPGADKYTQNKLLANYYNSKGLKFDADKFPTNFEDEAKIFNDNQTSQKSLLTQQLESAKTKAQQQSAYSQAAVQPGANREGIQSTGNTMAGQQTVQGIQGDTSLQLQGLNQQEQQLQQSLVDNQTNFIAGREEQIRTQLAAVQEQKAKLVTAQNQQVDNSTKFLDTLQKSGALANLSPDEVQFLQSGMPGVPQGIVAALADASTRSLATDQQKAQFDKQTTSLNTFKGLAAQGVQMPNSALLSMAKETGLPLEALMSFNDSAQQITTDKTLDQAQKAQQIQELGNKLDQQSRGIFNEAQQNTDYLSQMYKSGASPEMISAFKSAAKIDDTNDPMYQAKLKYQQAQAAIEDKHSRGEAVTPEDQLNLAKVQQEMVDYGGAPSAVIPSGSGGKYQMTASNNGVNLAGAVKGAIGGQCGHFVNQVFGKNIMQDSFASKMKLTDPSVKVPTPGMAFVMQTAGASAPYGHTGIVESVNKDGTVNVVDSNWHNNEKIDRHTLPLSAFSGFIRPPGGQDITQGKTQPQQLGLSAIRSMSMSDLNKGLDDGSIDLNMLSPKAFDQVKQTLGEDRIKELQSNGSSSASASKMSNDDIETAAKQLLDGKAFPSGKFKQQILNKAAQLDTSGTFDATAAEADYKAKTENAASYDKLKNAADASLSLFDTLKTQQADAYKALQSKWSLVNPWGIRGQQGFKDEKAVSENYGFKGFKTVQGSLSDLQGQIGLVAANGGSPHDETLKSLVNSLDPTQDPESFAASLEGIKQAMQRKEDYVKQSQTNTKKYGTYDNQGKGSADLAPLIKQAISEKHSSQDIVDYLKNNPQYGSLVQQALKEGHSADDIVNYLNK